MNTLLRTRSMGWRGASGLVLSWLALACGAPVALAQNASQRVTVSVADRLTISAPAEVTITHDQTDGDQAFPRQTWSVGGNVIGGMLVQFATDGPFVHQNIAESKSDAELAVAIASSQGPARWSLVQPVDTTRHAAGQETATVQVRSDAIGSAEVALDVRMIATPSDTLVRGNYSTTIRCTLTIP